MHKYKQKNIIKKFVLVFLFVVCGAFISLAQELKLKGFIHLDGNTTARINKRRDVNGQYCAIIIIKHNFKDFKVESGKDYEHLEEKIGETWVWVSPDEYQIVIRKEGYIPFRYSFKDKLKELETYELIITDEFGTINVSALQAQIWLDNKPVAKNSYIFKLKAGKFILKATRDKYYDEEEFVVLNAGDNLVYSFNLKPKMGNIIINSSSNETLGANVYINNNLEGKTNVTVPLVIGRHSLRLEKDGFLPYSQNILVEENKNTLVNAVMEVDPSILMQKFKKRKNIWLGSTIGSTGIGIFSMIKSNQLYDEYQTATANATDLHQKIETYDIITPVAFVVAGVCLVEFFIQNSKYKKAKRKLKVHPSYSLNAGSLSITYSF